MILLIHNNIDVCKVLDFKTKKIIEISTKGLNETFFALAVQFPEKKIVWCNGQLEDYICFEALEECTDLSLKMCSFETSNNNFIDTSIGFVDQSCFVNINNKVFYPTWLMSSDIGVISSSTLIEFKQLLAESLFFEELLNYIAKQGMQKGLLCYSNPTLLSKGYPILHKKSITKSKLFQFIKSNYKYRWVWLYQFNQLIYNKKSFITPYLSSLFKKTITLLNIKMSLITLQSKRTEHTPSIDVLIPTLGREQYLKDVLLDLSKQTQLPTRIIIVEQQAIENTPSSLAYLKEENWPFEIDHTLIYQLGACNARNIALSKVKSDWVFFADDDIRMDKTFLEQSFKYIEAYNTKGITLSCLQKDEQEQLKNVIQWNSFGSGCSIVNRSFLKSLKFDIALEFGYGEDSDFGVQLRNKGLDILYIPFIKMLHLKAPIGGFRKKIVNAWDNDAIFPKPSPTVMVSKLKHASKEQLQLYKTILFFKYYRVQDIKNPISYYLKFKKQWARSIFWAHKLMKTATNEI